VASDRPATQSRNSKVKMASAGGKAKSSSAARESESSSARSKNQLPSRVHELQCHA